MSDLVGEATAEVVVDCPVNLDRTSLVVPLSSIPGLEKRLKSMEPVPDIGLTMNILTMVGGAYQILRKPDTLIFVNDGSGMKRIAGRSVVDGAFLP